MRPAVIGLFIFGSRYNVSLHKVQKQKQNTKKIVNGTKIVEIIEKNKNQNIQTWSRHIVQKGNQMM